MPLPGGLDFVIPMTQAPLNPADPLYGDPQYSHANEVSAWLVTLSDYYLYDGNGNVGSMHPLPGDVKLDQGSLVAFGGRNTNQPIGYFWSSPLSSILRFDRITIEVQSAQLLNFVNDVRSIAVSGQGVLTMVSDGTGYRINYIDGTGTTIFNANGGGAALGQFSNAQYQSYAPNGLLHVLDYGNHRVQSLDPNNAFAPVGQFSLQTGVTTANETFAIGPAGNFYFGDGQGGATEYAANGAYLGAFTSPVSTPSNYLSANSYVSADETGNVFVFDATGAHQFIDSKVAAPEPGTASLLLLAGAGMLLRRRR